MKKVINKDFTKRKADPKNYENTIKFRLLDVKEKDEEDIAKGNLIKCKKASWLRYFY